MNISSSISPVAQTTYIPPVSATSATSSTDPTSATTGSTQLSSMAQLMSQLQSLESSDPEKAKSVLAKIGSDLKSKADSTGDTKLGALADKFTQASQTGNLSPLEQTKGSGGHGGHHHHHGGGGGGQSPATASSQVGAYQQSGSDPMSEIESAISSALAS